MRLRLFRHIFALALLVAQGAACCGGASAARPEPLGQLLVRFLHQPQSQRSLCFSDARVDGSALRPGEVPVPYDATAPVAIVCADSLSAGEAASGGLVRLFSWRLNQALSLRFSPSQQGFRLKSSERDVPGKVPDEEFANFLREYSKNHDLQLKRTIFPLPIRHIVGGREGGTSLQMPRDWNYMDFTASFPQICFLGLPAPAGCNNRRLYVFEKGRLARTFNFISINHKWFLIEIESH